MQHTPGANRERRSSTDPPRAATGIGDYRLPPGAKPEAVWGTSGRDRVPQAGQPAVRRHVEGVDAAAHLLSDDDVGTRGSESDLLGRRRGRRERDGWGRRWDEGMTGQQQTCDGVAALVEDLNPAAAGGDAHGVGTARRSRIDEP